MSIYDLITHKILELLEQGIVPWQRPWSVLTPRNLYSDKEYRGVNIMLLSFTRYRSPYWVTYKQAMSLGGFVREGEKGYPIVFWKLVKKDDRYPSDDESNFIPLLRQYTVFNAEQCGNLSIPDISMPDVIPLDECEAVMEKMPKKPTIHHGGDKACYIPSRDAILMPHKEDFTSIEAYYSTLFHEAVHSTGHEDRLCRKAIIEPHGYGSDSYSKEELIAEIGSGFLCSITGIGATTIENQASYIGNWLKRLSNDKKLIITAASHAQKACDYILDRIQDK